MPYKNELEAALARITALERELVEAREQRPAKALLDRNPTTEEGILQMHLDNIADPPDKLFFRVVYDMPGSAKWTILTDDDNPRLALAYQIKVGIVRRQVTSVCVWKDAYRWRAHKDTMQIFKWRKAQRLITAIQALHLRTRLKGPFKEIK